eukprot:6348748-Pyramimonas_sp.AAC.1
MESDLREAVKGPDFGWLEDRDCPRAAATWDAQPMGEGPELRRKLMQELESEGIFAPLKGA